MDLRLMRYFAAVARDRNFSRAAESLHLSQSPLSRQIQQLEEEVGVPLLDRETRPLQLTEAGRVFLEHSAQILGRVDDLEAVMQRFRNPDRPSFKIGFVASTIYAAQPDLLRRFRLLAPEIDLSLIEIASVKQPAALRDRSIDVGFGRIRFEDAAVQRNVLREERLVVALPKRHHMANLEHAVSFASLEGEPLIIYPREPRPSYADQVIALFHDRGMEPRIVQEAVELQTAVGLVAAEIGVTIVPESVKRLRRDDLVYLDFEEVSITSPIIMSRRAGDDSKQVALMDEVILQAYKEWGWPAPQGIGTAKN